MAPTAVSTSEATPLSTNVGQTDEVAIAALVLGAAAFVIAFLQVVIAYVTSSPAREKCSRGAIGGWQQYVQTGWDLLNWRLHVVYPHVDLSVSSLLAERQSDELGQQLLFPDLLRLDQYGWRDVSQCDERYELKWWHIWYGSSAFVKRGKVVTILGLCTENRVRWVKYLWEHRWRYRPLWTRASWANMIECFGVNPTLAKGLILRKERADIIPSCLDAPVQTTTLANIGLCCFVLGLREVDIDVATGKISAKNEYAAMSTLEPQGPGVPRLIGLSGDLESLRANISKPLTSELNTAAATANGKSDYIRFRVSSFFYDPSVILYGVQHQWDDETWIKYCNLRREEVRTDGAVGNLFAEGDMAKHCTGEWSQYWKSVKTGATPSLLQSLSFLPFLNICSGYPWTAFLAPYHNHVSEKALKWWKGQQEKMCHVDDMLTFTYRNGGVPFMKATNSFDLTGSKVATSHGCRSWMLQSAEEGLDTLDPVIYAAIINIDQSFPILDIIERLLSDGLAAARRIIEAHRSRMISNFYGLQITLEAAIWFTLYTVERRIESFWDQAFNIKTPEDKAMQKRLKEQKEAGAMQRAIAAKVKITKILDGSAGLELPPVVASFLGLWMTVCKETDPFSPADEFQLEFDKTLELWKDDPRPCIEKPSLEIRGNLPAIEGIEMQERRQFFEWGSHESRREVLQQLLPWLQLRAIILYYFLSCFGDSSKVSTAETAELHVQMS
jgi:hypothetical protein